MATDNFGTQGFDDDEVSGKELGEDRKRNLDGVEWTYGAGGVGGVDLGSRGVTDEVGGNYTVEVAGNTSETIEGTKTSNTTGAVVHRGSTIDLNP